MQSLRTKRDAPGKGRPQQQGARLAKPNGSGPTPRTRDARKSRVDDKIRKRMSMRYADISSPTELNMPPMPAMPTMPTRTIPGREQDEVVKQRSTGREERKEDDKKLLDKDDFDPDAFLKLKMANSTESEIKSLQSSLRNAKDDTASELQRNVFKNYAEFVLISKEISTLENEMLELKESISEYKSMPSLLHIPDPTSTSTSGLSSYRRSSMADLRIMYFNQMQTLHAQIEGSAKFAPTTPGRHVVAEIEGVIALNAATYKPTGKAKFVAHPRVGAGGSNEGKLVAERCWALNEMLVLDTKDSPSMTNVFKIRHGKETHELSAKKRKEREGEHERRKSMWNGGGGMGGGNSDRPPMPDWMSDLARRVGDPDAAGTDAKEKAERDTQWTNDWADELTVAIALREWELATDLVEKGRNKLPTTPPVATKLPALTSQLTTSLLQSLSQTTNRKSTVMSVISLLLRLNAGAAARTTFLNMRSHVMRNHVRKIRFEGHIGAYVGDLAIVFFTGIKNTADWYLSSFKENEGASAFIDWARKQIEDYGELFRRQVYSPDVDKKVVDEALMITRAQSKKLLQEYGLDFRFLFSDVLSATPKNNVMTPMNFTLQGHQVAKASRNTPSVLSVTSASSSSGSSQIPPSSSASSVTPIISLPTSTSSSSRVDRDRERERERDRDRDRDRERDRDRDTPPRSDTVTPSRGTRDRERDLPPRSDTATPSRGTRGQPPAPLTIQPDLPIPMSSPTPRRTRSPPPSASVSVVSMGSNRSGTPGRERPPRSGRPMGMPPTPGPIVPATPPPPRSANRPGSAISRGGVFREGMI
ncbi:Exocyst complex component [Mycena chlorophos]|uniref:Exocyst complex component EXO84 n=1 Tax=Mycena chlorophos TaxID=658473 RepID=A0A8H6SQ68_MYCCL|nr:Exocyst complex component [Mycena chlorophos]